MKLKTIEYENFNHYKKPSMVLGFNRCSFKCDKECGMQVCQNSVLATAKDIEYSNDYIVDKYLNNHITNAIVCAGLEPFDSWEDLFAIIKSLREKTNDDIVIYTGYNKVEIANKIPLLSQYKNIIIKYGRFIPNQECHIDDILGINLKSNNQYAERIS